MRVLQTLAVSLCVTSLCLMVSMAGGCATASHATEKAPAYKSYTGAAGTQIGTLTTALRATADSALIPGQTTPSREEELWVVAKYQGNEQPAPADEQTPGTGSLIARLPDQAAPVPVPLKHTDVKADIAGYVATVDVTQQYANPFSSKIEALTSSRCRTTPPSMNSS
jgi:hypothetical protein